MISRSTMGIRMEATKTERGPAKAGAAQREKRPKRMSWWMFHGHLWLGIISTVLVILVCITGILLNHKRGLGLMPDVPNEASGVLATALPIGELAARAEAAVGADVAAAGIDRMDVRPGDGLIKVRFDDRAVTEATVDIHTGEVLHVGARNDVFLEKLHSGEIFGSRGILLSDFAAIVLTILVITGIWLWIYPRTKHT